MPTHGLRPQLADHQIDSKFNCFENRIKIGRVGPVLVYTGWGKLKQFFLSSHSKVVVAVVVSYSIDLCFME